MNNFDDTRWADSAFAREYLESADHCIPERQYLFRVLRSFLRAFVARRGQAIRLCDLGCGDGVLTEQLLREGPSLEAMLVDGSTEMLACARKRLGDRKNIRFVQQSFDGFVEGAAPIGLFDLVISGFAIHHLHRPERRKLSVAIARHLETGGFFLNLDVALPDSDLYTEWQYALWSEWIDQHSKQFGLGAAFLTVPQQARANPDNKYSPLAEQLADLRDAGFADVECHYKNGVFAIYSGRRP